MATKTKEGAAAHSDAETAAEDVTAVEETPRTGSGDEHPEPEADRAAKEDREPEDDVEPEEDAETEAEVSTGVGQGAGAVVSAALGLVSLSGGWIGTVAGARQQLVGQLRTSSTATVAKQIKAVYGDAWHSTAMWAGVFALAALLTGVVVLVRPAFGTPGRPQTPWIRSVAWAGVSLGVIGLLLAVLKYSDALLALPSAG
ncbi:hypothetical protein ACFC8N_22960 [Streptomyces sp. NPDC055966]|uniref:hypothetical protein n=1 Tax=Streptomyces sp. NPDC055966 TaxID=3345669 RepID=UPI0035E0ED78